MKIRIVFILSLLLVLTSANFGQRSTTARTKKLQAEVKATFDRLVEGINQVDADKVMSVYDKGPRTLFFNYNGTATIGWENMNANRKASYAKRKNVTLEITGLRVEMLSTTSAYVSCKWKQTQEFDEKLEQSTGRMTLVFKKWKTGWKVLHLHTSPDSFPSDVVIPPSEKKETPASTDQKDQRRR